MSKHFSKTKVSSAVRKRNGPDTADIHSAPLDSHVLVDRPELDRWDGPFTLLDIKGETCTVLLTPPSGPKEFRTTVVKRYIPEDQSGNGPANRAAENSDSTEGSNTPQALDLTIESKHNDNNERASNVDMNELMLYSAKVMTQCKDHKKYAASRKKEIGGLINRGVFMPATVADAEGNRIYGSSFVDYNKHEGTPEAYEKSRFIIQGFDDEQDFLTHAPTVLRASERLLLSAAPCEPKLKVKNPDVDQAFAQAKRKLRRLVYVRPNAVLGYPPDFIFLAIYPIFCLPESSIHWFSTYSGHHKEKLNMIPSIYETCFMYTPKCLVSSSSSENAPRGMVCLQTDDTLYAGNEEFSQLEERMSASFDTNPGLLIEDCTKLKLNGAIFSRHNSNYSITQPDHIKRLTILDVDKATKYDFVAERARGAYIAAVCRPDATYAFIVASQITKPEKKDYKNLNKVIQSMLNSFGKGLNFVPLDLDSIFMAVFVDADFATNHYSSSQLGFLVTLMDKSGNANIVHYGSVKSKRITGSVLASELFATVHGFDISSTIRLTLNSMLDRVIPLHLYTDSRSLYECLTRINRTTEKRLLIDLRMLRQSYERRKITEVLWIPTAQNPADAFTKPIPCSALKHLIADNRLNLTPNAWVQRSDPTWSQNLIASVCAIF